MQETKKKKRAVALFVIVLICLCGWWAVRKEGFFLDEIYSYGASVTPTVIKSSAGAAERLPVARVANIGETIRRLKEQGVFVYCADMDGVSLRRNNLTGPIALVLGSEGSGVSQLVKKLCDGVVRLDMAAPGTGVDSYNVSVAAGIILYEIQSQRAAQQE